MTVARLDRAISKSALRDDVTVYRGVGPDALRYWPPLRKGAVIEERAFLSTSRRLEEALKFRPRGGILTVISARKGQHGMEVSKVSSVGTAEREILFARGSRLRVVRWERETQTLFLERDG